MTCVCQYVPGLTYSGLEIFTNKNKNVMWTYCIGLSMYTLSLFSVETTKSSSVRMGQSYEIRIALLCSGLLFSIYELR